MVAYPAVQAKAQAEVDTVVGQSRTPTEEDLDSLVYVKAVIEEVNSALEGFAVDRPWRLEC
jgi:hypothetical protein